ncbi:MFS transporter [Lysinibacillus endophyticus]|mgnify:CR=1 FL=1|uniref:MFS transporter n=1 Tax=Ureibacillus endophyticus TaxID=1978490 RepID=UPI00209ED925|nr:MFS transporter [Lysinibacillus endophyticus]MCP1145778.1 MFS transporter [Lysinibacillus endophyticus]
MSNTNEKLWTKDFIMVSITNFIVLLIFYLLMVTTSSFAVNEYHATASQAGLATGIYIVGTLIGRLFTGRYISTFGVKKIVVLGLIAFTCTTGLYFVHAGITFLLISRLINGMAAGITSTATGTLVAQIVPMSRKGEGIGYFSMSTTLGTAIGPFLGIFLARFVSYNMIFFICVILAALALIISFTLKPSAVKPVAKGKEQTKQSFSFKNYIEPNAIAIAIVTFFMSFGYAALLSFLTFFAEERHLITAASFFFLVYAIAVLLTRPFSGRFMDTKGSNFVMIPCFILFALGLFLVSAAHTGGLLLVAAAIVGAGYGNLQSGAQAIAIKLTPPERSGLATSTFFIALDAGLGFGPSILGAIEPAIGYGNLFITLGFITIFSLALYIVLHGRKDKKLIQI